MCEIKIVNAIEIAKSAKMILEIKYRCSTN